MSFVPEVIADDSGKFVGNGLRFATSEEAEVWARDLSMRWLLVRETRATESDDPVNARMTRKDDEAWLMEHLPDAEGPRDQSV